MVICSAKDPLRELGVQVRVILCALGITRVFFFRRTSSLPGIDPLTRHCQHGIHSKISAAAGEDGGHGREGREARARQSLDQVVRHAEPQCLHVHVLSCTATITTHFRATCPVHPPISSITGAVSGDLLTDA